MGGGSHVAKITGNILTEKGNLAFCASLPTKSWNHVKNMQIKGSFTQRRKRDFWNL